MLFSPSSVADSNLSVIFGDVFDALIKPHDSSFDILIPSIKETLYSSNLT